MKILFETNFLYSALFHSSVKFDAILEIVFAGNEPLILDYVSEELPRKALEKRLDAIDIVHAFLQQIQITNTHGEIFADEIPYLRDSKDQSILNAAIPADVAIIISGDKDFTSLEIDRPRIMTPAACFAEFMQ